MNLICNKCGYKWEPNPNKWTKFPGKGRKFLKCPMCFKWNTMIISSDLQEEFVKGKVVEERDSDFRASVKSLGDY